MRTMKTLLVSSGKFRRAIRSYLSGDVFESSLSEDAISKALHLVPNLIILDQWLKDRLLHRLQWNCPNALIIIVDEYPNALNEHLAMANGCYTYVPRIVDAMNAAVFLANNEITSSFSLAVSPEVVRNALRPLWPDPHTPSV